jgi:TonB family protein
MDSDKKLKHFIKQPIFKGGDKAFTQAIYSQLQYPKAAFDKKLEGTVYIEYDIDFKGNVLETRVLKGIGSGCDEEACRVLKTLKFDVPTTRGVRVLFHKKVKVQFKIAAAPPAPAPQIVQYNYVPTAPSMPAAETKSESPKSGTITYQIKIS